MLEKFRNELADVFEISSKMINEDKVFASKAPWDSLKVLSAISLIDEYYSVALSTSEIVKCKDLSELLDTIRGRGAKI